MRLVEWFRDRREPEPEDEQRLAEVEQKLLGIERRLADVERDLEELGLSPEVEDDGTV